MNFLHPAFLWGFVAVSVPLILHFLLRRRVRQVRFSSLALLRLLQQKRSKRMRLAQLLLLILRILIVATVVLLFAQPLFKTGFFSRFNAGPETVVILLDNSPSAGLKYTDDEKVYDKMAQSLQAVVHGLDPRTVAVIVSLSPKAQVLYRGGAAHFDIKVLRKLAPTRPDIAGAVSQLETLFSDTPAGRRRLVCLSDFQKFPWDEALKGLVSLPYTLDLRRVEHGAFANWSIIKIVPVEQKAVIGEACAFSVELAYAFRGYTPSATRIVATIDDEVVAAMPISPNQGKNSSVKGTISGRVRQTIPLVVKKEGFNVVRFRLDDDSLQSDNETTTGVNVVHQRHILLFNGDPRSAKMNDELFFLRKVYEKAVEQKYRLREFSGADGPALGELNQAAVVHLASFTIPDDGLAASLCEYIKGGGTLVLWAGDKLDGPTTNRRLLAPLGVDLRLQGRGEQASGWVVNSAADTPLGHLLSTTFVSSIRSRKHFFVATSSQGGQANTTSTDLGRQRGKEKAKKSNSSVSRAALTLSDGTPLLSVYPIGSGHLCFFNTSADQEWSDAPLHPLFPVLLSQLPRLTQSGVARLTPGERYVVDVPLAGRGDATAEVRTPDGRKVVVQAEFSGERFCFAFVSTWWPGVYRMVRTVGKERTEDIFEVFPDGEEASLHYVGEGQLQRFTGETTEAMQEKHSSVVFRMSDLLFLALLLLLVAEGFVLSVIERTIHGEVDGAQ